MIYDHVCRKCRSCDLQVSRTRNPIEALISPWIVTYRCMECGERQPKFKSIEVGPNLPRGRVRYRAN